MLNNGFVITAVERQLCVWQALILHDIKGRFFGNGFGFLLMMVWPLAHIIILLVINSGRLPPHGSSMVLYVATGVVPYICFNYIARFTMMSALQNKSFLQYTEVQPIDIIVARLALEIMSNFSVVCLLMIFMSLLGINVLPVDPGQAALAWLAAVFFGMGFGCANSVIVMAFPMWFIVSIAFSICMWITSGTILDPELLPKPYGYYMSFNPLVHAVEWMRLAYYPDFNASLIDKQYILTVSAVFFGVGFTMLRFARGFTLKMR